MITTQKELRKLFWTIYDKPHKQHGAIFGKGSWPLHIRFKWIDFVEDQCRNKQITEALAQRAWL